MQCESARRNSDHAIASISPAGFQASLNLPQKRSRGVQMAMVKHQLRDQYAALDPVIMLKYIDNVQQELGAANPETGTAGSLLQRQYLGAFATAWHRH